MINRFLMLVLIFLSYGCTFSGKTKFDEGLDVAKLKGSEVTLFSIEPYKEKESAATQFNGYPVLGSVVLSSQQSEDLLTQLSDGVWNWRLKNAVIQSTYACFNPRHAIRVKQQKEIYDYVICFECQGISMYKNGVGYSYAGIDGDSNDFYNVLIKAGVKLSEN